MVAGEFIPCLMDIKAKYGLNKLFIMVQDVAHARAAGDATGKMASEKGWEIVGKESLSNRNHRFLRGFAQSQKGQCPGPSHRHGYAGKLHPSQAVVRYENSCLPFGTIIAAAEQPGFYKATEGKGEYLPCQCGQCRQCPIESDSHGR